MSAEVQVRYFAAARELASCESELVVLPAAEVSTTDLLELLALRHPRLAPYLSRLRLAINDELRYDTPLVRAGDVIDVMPPVAGGSPAGDTSSGGGDITDRPAVGVNANARTDSAEAARAGAAVSAGAATGALAAVGAGAAIGASASPKGAATSSDSGWIELAGGRGRVAIRSTALSVDEALASVKHPTAGGITLFVGVVRNHAEGKAVDRLDYEAHDTLAVRELTNVANEVLASDAKVRVCAVHRVGALAIGDFAVVVAASAPHRAEAFAACRALIEKIKERVPIWKKEWGTDGGAEWVNL